MQILQTYSSVLVRKSFGKFSPLALRRRQA
jgi:hypothetical protein